MTLTVRKAVRGDLPALLAICGDARRLCRPGNPTQWPAGYPGAARLTAEIDRGVCHVVTGREEYRPFCLIPARTPPTAKSRRCMAGRCPYATIHRLASAGQVGGIGRSALTGACSEGCRCGPIPLPTTSTCSARSRQPALCAAA